MLASPLSTRKALLVAALIDAFVDRLFASQGEIDDVLEFRAWEAAASPELARVMALCAQRGELRLDFRNVEVPIAAYPTLAVEDFMVSLYNDHSVQRLALVSPGGAAWDALETLAGAIAALDERMVTN